MTLENTNFSPATLTVSELSETIKTLLEDTFQFVSVKGEISGFKIAPSGHAYFALKDEKSVIDAVCWRAKMASLSLQVTDGIEVICFGQVTAYAGRSKYQINVEKIEISGEGTLLKLLEERKKKLKEEGLFDINRKKPLPFLPQTIGVITSKKGAVIKDILHRLEERFPRHVILWPVMVQGEGAAEQIAEAIKGFNSIPKDHTIPRPDLLIVARGGGSIEDLWAFNEEIVVRAAASSQIPLISAVGHETDTTLIDYASDKRAPTPTAAAEIAVPVRYELLKLVNDYHKRVTHTLKRRILENSQRFDDWGQRFSACQTQYFEKQNLLIQHLKARLRHPQDLVNQSSLKLESLKERLVLSMKRTLQDDTTRLTGLGQLLQSYSYHNTLKRGFCMVRDDHQKIIKSQEEATPGAYINIIFHDGSKKAQILKKTEKTAKSPQDPVSPPQYKLWQ